MISQLIIPKTATVLLFTALASLSLHAYTYEPLAMAVAVKKTSSDMAFWDYVKKEDSIEYYQTYLTKYPQGTFVLIAKQKLKELQKKKRQEKERAHIGIGGGVVGLEIWIRKKHFSYGFAVKSTANLKTIETAAFTNYHLSKEDNSAYLAVSFGYQYLNNKEYKYFTPGVGLGIGYRATFLDLIYIDYGIKALVNKEYITTSFHTFTGFDF